MIILFKYITFSYYMSVLSKNENSKYFRHILPRWSQLLLLVLIPFCYFLSHTTKNVVFLVLLLGDVFFFFTAIAYRHQAGTLESLGFCRDFRCEILAAMVTSLLQINFKARTNKLCWNLTMGLMITEEFKSI